MMLSFFPVGLWCLAVGILVSSWNENASQCCIQSASCLFDNLFLNAAFCCKCNKKDLRDLEEIDQLLLDMKIETNAIADVDIHVNVDLKRQQKWKNPFLAKNKVIKAQHILNCLESYQQELESNLPNLLESSIGWKVSKDILNLIASFLLVL